MRQDPSVEDLPVTGTAPVTVRPRPALDVSRYGPVANVDMDAVRRYRLGRLRGQMAHLGIGACLLSDPVNIRYACDSSNMQVWVLHNLVRQLFVSASGPLVLYDFHGSQHLSGGLGTVDEVRPAYSLQFFGAGGRLSGIAKRFAAEIAGLVRAHCGAERRVAVDRLHPLAAFALREAGLEIVDAGVPLELARAVKSGAEIACMRAAIDTCQEGMRRMHENARPGMTENQVWAMLHAANVERGGEWIETRLLSSGPRTNPWFQECGHRVIEAGDLVSYDTDLVGPYGYCADISRSFVCGARPDRRQRSLYAVAMEQIRHNMALLRPGLSFDEFAARSFVLPQGYRRGHYSCIAHGIGLCDEHPLIAYPEDAERGTSTGEFVPGMTVCVESYVGADSGGEGVKLEQQVLVTETGAELLSDFPLEENLHDACP